MKKQIAFLDEFGDHSLNTSKKDVSTHFIVTAVIVDSDKVIEFEQKLEIIRKKYFQEGEIKSKKVGSNDSRRILILNDFVETDIKFYSVIVNKKEILGEGLKHKKVFYKYIPGLVYKELYRSFPFLKIASDEHGKSVFMIKFKEYIQNNHVTDLFNQSEFEFVDSKSNLLVQAADFISGTLARCYDENKKSDKSREFMLLLNKISLGIHPWPLKFKNILFLEHGGIGKFDNEISVLGLNLALSFIKSKEKSSIPFEIDQLRCLRYLMNCFQFAPNNFVSTNEIMRYIFRIKGKDISEHYFRSKIIAKLRDFGVIISSSNKGYKLPNNESDIFNFINQSCITILPMISRIKKCRDSIKLTTKNQLDILSKEEYTDIKRLLDFESEKIGSQKNIMLSTFNSHLRVNSGHTLK